MSNRITSDGSADQLQEDRREVVTVSSACQECEGQFELLLDSMSPSSIPLANKDGFREAIENQSGRFRVWCGNLGALRSQVHRSSLDARLARAPRTSHSVLSNLSSLKNCLQRMLDIVSGKQPIRSGVFEDDAKEDASATGTAAKPTSVHGQTQVTTTELDELCKQLRNTITRLFKIAMLIREHKPRGKIPKTDLAPIDASYDIGHVWEKFEKARESQWPIDRLGRAIIERREYLRYREQHRAKLAIREEEASGKGKAPRQDSELGDHAAGQEKKSRAAPNTVATSFEDSVNGPRSKEISSTEFSRPVSQGSLTSYATSIADLAVGTLRVPEPPTQLEDGSTFEYDEPFECPYCRTIQVVSSRSGWKRHVFSDLRPYSCTFETCAADSFTSRHEWFHHELSQHRGKWNCNMCDDWNSDMESGLTSHFSAIHPGQVTEVQMLMLSQICRTAVTSFGDDDCPLCADWKPPVSLNASRDNVRQFRRHLGKHMEQLALAALPRADIEGDEQQTREHFYCYRCDMCWYCDRYEGALLKSGSLETFGKLMNPDVRATLASIRITGEYSEDHRDFMTSKRASRYRAAMNSRTILWQPRASCPQCDADLLEMPNPVEPFQRSDDESSREGSQSGRSEDSVVRDVQNEPPLFPQPPASSFQVFGVCLEDLCKLHALMLPEIIFECIRAIEQYGSHMRDIYEIDVKGDQVNDLITKINHGFSVDFEDRAAYYDNIHIPATLLKTFLQALPKAVIPANESTGFILAMREDSIGNTAHKLREEIHSLSEAHRDLLMILLRHFRHLQQKAPDREAESEKLAGIFAPILMERDKSILYYKPKAVGALKFAIDHRSTVIPQISDP